MIEKTFLNPATNKQWRIEIDGHTIRTCLNGGKVKEDVYKRQPAVQNSWPKWRKP